MSEPKFKWGDKVRLCSSAKLDKFKKCLFIYIGEETDYYLLIGDETARKLNNYSLTGVFRCGKGKLKLAIDTLFEEDI